MDLGRRVPPSNTFRPACRPWTDAQMRDRCRVDKTAPTRNEVAPSRECRSPLCWSSTETPSAAADPVSYWSTWAELVSSCGGGSDGALAWFAKVQIDTANREKQDRRAVADARISALALRSTAAGQVMARFGQRAANRQVEAEISDLCAGGESPPNGAGRSARLLHGARRPPRGAERATIAPWTCLTSCRLAVEMSVDKGASIWGGLSTLHAEVESCADSLRGAIDAELRRLTRASAPLRGG